MSKDKILKAIKALKKGKEKTINIFFILFKKRKVRRLTAAFLFFILITMLISVEFMPPKIRLKEGEVSSRDIFAPHTVIFEDKEKTRQLREEAAKAINNQYDQSHEASVTVQKDISKAIASIREIQEDKKTNLTSKIKDLQGLLDFSLSQETYTALAKPSLEELNRLEKETNRLVSQIMKEEEITLENIAKFKKELFKKIEYFPVNKPYQELAYGLINNYFRPNTIFNPEKTHLLREAAMAAVPPQQVIIRQGEKIIGAGEIVQPETLVKLNALGLAETLVPWRTIVGNALLVIILMLVVLVYLYQQNRKIFNRAGYLYLIGIIVVMVLAVAKAIVFGNVAQWPELGALFGYMAPLAAAGMLIAILLDSRLAVLIATIMSFLLVIMTDGQVRFGLVGLVSSITGIYGVGKLSQRGDMVKAGIFTGIAGVITIGIMGILSNASASLILTSSILFGLINGFLSSVLTIGFLPYLEGIFGITSAVRLLELSHPNNPLLKRLLTEAPGTYYHSLIVGNLAEAAADEVEADGLLARVGAYYHDIGKLKRPYFFIENQIAKNNPHDKITPSLSTLIVTSHVKDGVEMAKENKLPAVIIKIIEQHHGSGLCTFFYHKALENGQKNKGNIKEIEFRYEGPKPQTKETAIIMLADVVEAAVRSLSNQTPGKIEGMVRKTIKEKLLDGQLDESDLTFKDLDRIAGAFVQVLNGIFHTRVEYPVLSKDIKEYKEVKEGERRKRIRNGRTGKQLAERSASK